MDSVCYHVVSGPGDENGYYINLENMPPIEDFTEEIKGEIALRILKNMKTSGFLKFVVYTEESKEKGMRDRTIDIV